MADEAFHEIQLNGKQLVFLFMAATVVAVVIFLCGVMVGRGVRPQRTTEMADAASDATQDPTANIQAVPRTDEAAPASPAASTASDEQLTYPERLADPAAPPETLNETGTSSRARTPEPRSENPNPRPTKNANSPNKNANQEPGTRNPEPATRVPPGDGFTVQVAAVKQRSEADTIAQRLARKGYAAYVMPPAAGAPPVFRVRVGKYKDRRDAESIAGRLEREEQFRPWVTK